MRELHLFAGAGGGILGGILLGHTCVCAVEIEPYCRQVLLQRQRDGCLPKFPIWDDVRTFDGRPWRGVVDVVCGGFPCQDISCAGSRRGIEGERSGLWSEFARIISEVRPRFAFIENSSDLAIRGLNRVLADLAALGMDAIWGVFSACATGAPHMRFRLFVLAYPKSGRARQLRRIKCPQESASKRNIHWTLSESGIARKVDGVAGVVDRLKATGNGQVPAVVRLAWETLVNL
jgi:DNA (cytosine-5)-methyltransferase 1